jgi:hypothetical protein
MSVVIKPPMPIINGFSVFLAGSIEMGKAKNWQTVIEKELADIPVIIYNPRRDNWDSSWIQSIDNPQFREQVEWELSAMEQSTYILMYFDPNTKSPVSLLELGLFALAKKLIVCCPNGFWRKGNVDIVCRRYDIKQVDSINGLVDNVKSDIKKMFLTQC